MSASKKDASGFRCIVFSGEHPLLPILQNIGKRVFLDEQELAIPAEEWQAPDHRRVHFLLLEKASDTPIGSTAYEPNSEHGVIEAFEEYLRRTIATPFDFVARVQVANKAFYEKNGYIAFDEPFADGTGPVLQLMHRSLPSQEAPGCIPEMTVEMPNT